MHSTLGEVKPFFMKGDIRFLTLRGHKSKEQRIGYVNDLLRKISSTYLIVREKNHSNDGFHFHAIVKVHTVPKKAWYRKGVHMNLKRVGYLIPKPNTFTARHMHDNLAGLEIDDAKRVLVAMSESNLDDYVQRATDVYVVRDSDISRVLCYMEKEMEMPCQYVDYIWSKRGKQCKLQKG